jgi:hypothetical protein
MGAKAVVRTDRVQAEGQGIEIPSVLQCGLTILLLKLMLRARGFASTISWIRQRMDCARPVVLADVGLVRRAERSVATAAAFYPSRARCLEQSLTLYYLLRRQGIAVKYCQGVQPQPFEAHAWIEYRGEVINDIAEHAKHFAPLPDQLP